MNAAAALPLATVAFLAEESGHKFCPSCQTEYAAAEGSEVADVALTRIDVEPSDACYGCNASLLYPEESDDGPRSRPNAWDEGGKEQWKEERS